MSDPVASPDPAASSGKEPERRTHTGTEPLEARSARLGRQAHHVRLYGYAVALVALLVVVIVLAIANTRQVKLSWVVGDSHASLVWIILVASVLGWLLGIVTSVVFRMRTRRRRTR